MSTKPRTNQTSRPKSAPKSKRGAKSTTAARPSLAALLREVQTLREHVLTLTRHVDRFHREHQTIKQRIFGVDFR